MNRTWVIWMVLVVCGLLIVGAMGWLTQRTLGMEYERIVAEAESTVEERARLALSRMDTAASAMLVVENQRAPEHYQAFYELTDLFTNALQSVEGKPMLQPSPLLSEPPEFIHLHFQVWAERKLTSPQVPTGNYRDLAESSGIARDEIEEADSRLSRLRIMLKPEDKDLDDSVSRRDNMESIISVNEPGAITWNSLPAEQVQKQSVQGEESVVQSAVNNYANPKEESSYQQSLTLQDQGRRKQVYDKAQSKAVESLEKKRDLNNKFKKGLSRSMASKLSESSLSESGLPLMRAGKAKAELPQAGAENADANFARSENIGNRSSASETIEVSRFRPLWLDGELFAVRRVDSVDGVRYQGFWIDAPTFEVSLLEQVSDLLPDARLTPVNALVGETIDGGFENAETLQVPDSRTLVTLPWRLEDGVELKIQMAGFTPLHASLGLGWMAVLLAMLAAAILVRGVLKMSARRAAFVSSVTHELRTPLTTFQLYSDLLAEGMVADAGKRQGYLESMRSEAGRLNHLIENVLSYSRIERGSARARRQRLTLASLVEQIQGRLADRVEREQARIEVIGLEDCGDVFVETDVTAVEQILFNLVDNACKYGLPINGERLISLRTWKDSKAVRISVCDSGRGIASKDRRKLFRPFHKSADEAAHSKPGVGLGLALCRRLARALGGDLTVDTRRDCGACFVLKLPSAK